jgi:hypothetical protein
VSVTRLRSLAGLALASTVLLTGCGAVPALTAGVAVRVDERTITMDEVNDVTAAYCRAAEDQLQEGQVLPQHYLRGQVAGGLALRAAAEQFADEQGVTAADDYDQAVAQAEQSLGSMPADERQALIDVQGASVYVSAVEKSAGQAILEQQGTTGATDAAAQKAGQQAFRSWLDDRDVRIDPRFGVAIEDGQTTPTDTSLSFALGETAKKADADQQDTTYAAGLPESQRCG